MNTTDLAVPPPPAKARFTYRCPVCQSENVRHDATAVWDGILQRYIITDIQDYCVCADCGHDSDTGQHFFVKL